MNTFTVRLADSSHVVEASHFIVKPAGTVVFYCPAGHPVYQVRLDEGAS